LKDLAALFLGSRVALLIVGLLAAGLLGSGLAVQKGNLTYHTQGPLPLEIWARWDAAWYLLIAEEGYLSSAAFAHLPRYEPEATAGFFPLYPLLIRGLTPLLGRIGAGVLISNLCLAGALLLLFRLTRDETGGDEGEAAGLAACAALLVFPASLFLSAVYPEALFLFLTLLAFDRARSGRFAVAGLSGFFAALTRPTGALLLLPLAFEWWGQRRKGGSRWGWAAALGPLCGTTLFMMMCARLFGDPLAFVHRQEHWRGATSGPWRAFVRWWQEGPAIHGAHDSTLEMLTALVLLALLPLAILKLRAPYAIHAAATILVPLCSTVWSFGRIALPAFPIFMILGMAATSPTGRRLVAIYMMVGAALSSFLMALYAAWWWAG
jgi:hypothetical protein